MLTRKGIFTTPSIMQSHVSVIRALARVTCIARHLHILYHVLPDLSIRSEIFFKFQFVQLHKKYLKHLSKNYFFYKMYKN